MSRGWRVRRYKSGVYDDAGCKGVTKKQLDHAVLVVSTVFLIPTIPVINYFCYPPELCECELHTSG